MTTRATARAIVEAARESEPGTRLLWIVAEIAMIDRAVRALRDVSADEFHPVCGDIVQLSRGVLVRVVAVGASLVGNSYHSIFGLESRAIERSYQAEAQRRLITGGMNG